VGQFDLFFADPPYNIGVDYGGGKAADSLTPDENLASCRRWLKLAANAVRPGGAVWLLLPDEWVGILDYVCRMELGLHMRNWIKWHETFGVQTTNKFARTSRHVLYYVRPSHPTTDDNRFTFNPDAVKVPSDRQTKYNDSRGAAGGKVMGDVWTVSRVAGTFSERAEGFKNQIPEELLTRVILSTTRPRDKVLEFFSGSGSLARVCLAEGRCYEGYERHGRNASRSHARVTERAAELRREKARVKIDLGNATTTVVVTKNQVPEGPRKNPEDFSDRG
jgi:site-specific DNA-methyltransferase (adenine-specific)